SRATPEAMAPRGGGGKGAMAEWKERGRFWKRGQPERRATGTVCAAPHPAAAIFSPQTGRRKPSSSLSPIVGVTEDAGSARQGDEGQRNGRRSECETPQRPGRPVFLDRRARFSSAGS